MPNLELTFPRCNLSFTVISIIIIWNCTRLKAGPSGRSLSANPDDLLIILYPFISGNKFLMNPVQSHNFEFCPLTGRVTLKFVPNHMTACTR